MSRFWAAAGSGGSDSDSDGSSEGSSSNYSSSDESSDQGGGGGAAGGGGGGGAAGAAGGNRWVAMSDSDSSDDEVRVVKSGKDRALESFQSHIKKLRGHMKERDYFAIQTEFDELAKSMIKARQYLADGVPRPLVRILVDLEDYTTESLKDKAQFKKLSARQGRALNRMKLALKKHNKAYQVVIEAYRKNPTVDAVSDDDDAGDGGKGKPSRAGSDSESSKSSASSSSSSSSSSSKKSSKSSGSSSSGSGKSSKSSSDSDSVRDCQVSLGSRRVMRKHVSQAPHVLNLSFLVLIVSKILSAGRRQRVLW
jgi:translation initiation factor 3 subunit C